MSNKKTKNDDNYNIMIRNQGDIQLINDLINKINNTYKTVNNAEYTATDNLGANSCML